jgi:hypothetical protein
MNKVSALLDEISCTKLNKINRTQSVYTQEGNKLDFFKNKNNFEKPQRGEINTAWGSAPGNLSGKSKMGQVVELIGTILRKKSDFFKKSDF